MGVLLMIIFLFISVLIVGLVLLQEGKGGGLTGMSTGMDGVMGAKNPLRRMTAYLFTFFVIMCLAINWYFHQRVDNSLPTGMGLPAPERTIEMELPTTGEVPGPNMADSEDRQSEDAGTQPEAETTEKTE